MKRLVYLATAALVAMMICVPVAPAQVTMEKSKEKTEEKTAPPLPKSGGLEVGPVIAPAAALLLGSGILAYATLRRRQ